MATVDDRTSTPGGPTWEIAHLFPNQGAWTVDEYLAMDTNHLVEFSEGTLEVLPMPTEEHQLIVAFLFEMLKTFIAPRKLGTVVFAPLRVQLWEGKFREPDIVFLLAEHADRRGDRFWRGADLVMEVVSEDDPDRDIVQKRDEYARAGIAEYWIVDPRDRTITVLALEATTGSYREVGTFGTGGRACSRLLEGFHVDVDAAFSQDGPGSAANTRL